MPPPGYQPPNGPLPPTGPPPYGYPAGPAQTPPPFPPRPRKKRTGLAIGLTLATLALVAVLIAAVALISGKVSTTKADPTPTLSGIRGSQSGWTGHLPDPCVGVPDSVVRQAGLDPTTRRTGGDRHRPYAVMASCFYRSPQPPGVRYNATNTWKFSVSFLVHTYQEHLDNPDRVDKRHIDLNGQPASYFRVQGWGPGRGLHECMISVGTVFGTANYTARDDLGYHLTQEQACNNATRGARLFQPFIPTAPLTK
ncbi:DUF3558 family protein [Gordonia crocea]|uniref:DUF3558 domain-containing protein n=1 Tax=Gordonia crocea TaxID=589162 RepID=A0A7I9UYP8_9ACTN|nr:hypothetical protein nbrc107697_20650 [Gordonia crocea]